ncbi:MAG: hypothetical protein IT381_04145 [Deltaproteobacteria bacterium]|nr:hypothetical protein [Deltaproteobacteria bacterium]
MSCEAIFLGNGSTTFHYRGGGSSAAVEQHFAVNPLYCGDDEGHHLTIDTEVMVRVPMDGTDDSLGGGVGARFMHWNPERSLVSGEVRAGVDVMNDALRLRVTGGVGIGFGAVTLGVGAAYQYATGEFVPDLSLGLRYGF